MWPLNPSYPILSAADVDGKTYDYVIVGGGTSGCVLASRLSEDPSVSVLVLEKGSIRDNFLSRIPLLSQNFVFPFLQTVSRLSEPVTAFHGRRARVWAAEALGGTSRVNGQLLTRGAPGGYNQWKEEFGLKEWGWDQVEPYFRRSENAYERPDAKCRGHDGPVMNRPSRSVLPSVLCADKAAEKVGLPLVEDGNDPRASAQGMMVIDSCISPGGTRVSTYKAWLHAGIARSRRDRLGVCTGVVASTLVVDDAESNDIKGLGRVKGVKIRNALRGDQKEYSVTARREVILASGAVCTPQLLMLSGIGPREGIEPLGIPLVKELPAVGKNFSDHMSVPVCMELPHWDTLHIIQTFFGFLWNLLLYIFLGAGLLADSSTARSIFVRSSAIDDQTLSVKSRDENGEDTMDASLARNIPDVEIMVLPITGLIDMVPGKTLFTWYATLVQPFSRGSVELVSRDPLAHPRLNHPLLQDKRDLEAMSKAVRFSMRLAEEFQSIYPQPAPLTFGPGMDLRVVDEVYSKENKKTGAAIPEFKPAPVAGPVDKSIMAESAAEKAQNELKSLSWRTVKEEEIEAYIRRTASSCYHVTSTCRMSLDEKDGVVDQRLKVHGFENLRIADASVLPKVTSAHTMAPTIMVAERCADFLKAEWGERKGR